MMDHVACQKRRAPPPLVVLIYRFFFVPFVFLVVPFSARSTRDWVGFWKAILASFLSFSGFSPRDPPESVLAASRDDAQDRQNRSARNVLRVRPGDAVSPTSSSRLAMRLLPTELAKRARTIPASGSARSSQCASS
jgi:hypothetical protein